MQLLNHVQHMKFLEQLVNICLVWAAQVTVVDASSFLAVFQDTPSSREAGDGASNDNDDSLTDLTDFETDAAAPLSKLLRDQVIVCCEGILLGRVLCIHPDRNLFLVNPIDTIWFQVQFADVILLNKVDCIGPEQLQQVRSSVALAIDNNADRTASRAAVARPRR